MTEKQKFEQLLQSFAATLQAHLCDSSGKWSIKGFIDIYRNIYTISADTKHGAYFIHRDSAKNIQFPYSSYQGHYCLGIIYDRASPAGIDETKIHTLAQLQSIASVIENFHIFAAEKWKIASDRSGSGNTANIGSIKNIEDIINGRGMFSRLGEAWFDDYWMNYRKIQALQPDGSYRPISNLRDFVAYRKGNPDLVVGQDSTDGRHS